MPKLAFLSLLATLLCASVSAQKIDYRFGKVSIDELKMTSYDKDPDANAVYLSEDCEIYYDFKQDLLRTTEYRARIKILKPEGVGQADISIFYNDNFKVRDNVFGIEAVAYNLVDGKIVKTPLKKQYIFKEDLSEDHRLLKFSIPEVREGTVIEYKYKIASKNFTYIPSFDFQHSIPVMHSHLHVVIPEYFVFKINLKGHLRIDVNESYSTDAIRQGTESLTFKTHEIETRTEHIPALKREPHIWYLDDFRSTLEFELSQIALPHSTVKNITTTWADVNESLQKTSFDTHCRIGNPFKDEVAAIKSGQGTAEEKILAVLRLVQSKMKWNEQYRLFSSGPRVAANKGTGSSADINFVLMAALKDAGFEVKPVLLSPRHSGRLPYTHPTIEGIHAFVVRIALENNNFVYVDGTNPNSNVNLLPVTLLVDRARIYGVNDDRAWCDLTKLVKSVSNINMVLKLNADNTMTGNFIEQYTNQMGLTTSTAYATAKSQEEYIESLEKEHNIQIEDLKVEGISTNMVTQQYRATIQASGTDEFVYINATAVPFMTTNSLNAQHRTLPIEFPLSTTYNIRCTVEIPKGYTVEELPRNINMTVLDNSARCRYVSNVAGQFVQINFQFTLDRIIYTPEEFADLNTFYGTVADLSNSQIVIRKK